MVYCGLGFSAFLISSSSKMSFEKALGFAFMHFCRATKGLTQSDPFSSAVLLRKQTNASENCVPQGPLRKSAMQGHSNAFSAFVSKDWFSSYPYATASAIKESSDGCVELSVGVELS